MVFRAWDFVILSIAFLTQGTPKTVMFLTVKMWCIKFSDHDCMLDEQLELKLHLCGFLTLAGFKTDKKPGPDSDRRSIIISLCQYS